MDVSQNSLEQENITSEQTAEICENNDSVQSPEVDMTDSSIEASTDFKKDDKEKEDTEEESSEDESTNEDSGNEEKQNEEDEEDTANKKKNGKYELLEQELDELKQQYANLQAQYETLVEFKNNIDNQQKDALIAEFYMLSDEDKKDVIQNKSKYSLEEIKSKLSVICFDKKINFSQEEKISADNGSENSSKITTYNINNDIDNLPEWVKEVKRNESNL